MAGLAAVRHVLTVAALLLAAELTASERAGRLVRAAGAGETALATGPVGLVLVPVGLGLLLFAG